MQRRLAPFPGEGPPPSALPSMPTSLPPVADATPESSEKSLRKLVAFQQSEDPPKRVVRGNAPRIERQLKVPSDDN